MYNFLACSSRVQNGQAYLNARLLGITVGVFSPHFPQFSNRRLEQHDVNIVVLFRQFGSQLSECAALHQLRFGAGGSTSNGSPKYSNSALVLSQTRSSNIPALSRITFMGRKSHFRKLSRSRGLQVTDTWICPSTCIELRDGKQQTDYGPVFPQNK